MKIPYYLDPESGPWIRSKVDRIFILAMPIVAALAIFVWAVGCAKTQPMTVASGPVFSGLESPPYGKAIVYVYNRLPGAPVFLWHARPISGEDALDAHEGIVVYYPLGVRMRGRRTSRPAASTNLRIIVPHAASEAAASVQRVRGVSYFIFGAEDAQPSVVDVASEGISVQELEDDDLRIALSEANAVADEYSVAVQRLLSTAPILFPANSFLRLVVEPGTVCFWLRSGSRSACPYARPTEMNELLAMEVEPGQQYFLRARQSRLHNIAHVALVSADVALREITVCREVEMLRSDSLADQ